MGNCLFTSGGGLSNSKLALADVLPDEVFRNKTYYANGSKELQTGTMAIDQATAVPGDVVASKTFYAGDKNLKTGTLAERPAITTAPSISSARTGQPYFRFPQGAYRTNASSGYPELTASRANILTAMNLNFSGNWEVIGFGGHMGYGWGTSNNENAQRCITWANGWSANLPQGMYRVLVCFGQNDSGGVDLSITIGGVEKSHAYDTYWNCDDVTFTGSGALVIRQGIADRNPSGVVIVVLHQR